MSTCNLYQWFRPWCLVGLAFFIHASAAQAAIVTADVNMRADQNVSLLGVDAQLSASGLVHWVFDVDGNGNSLPGGASTLDAFFQGVLPTEFGALAGAPFDLFSIDGQETVTVTGNGTHVNAGTTFGLKIYAAPNVVLANFFTQAPSTFESNVNSLTNFGAASFQDPLRPNDVTQVFIGANGLAIAPNSLVGASFNRTVTAVPEPSSLALMAALGMSLCARRAWRGSPTSGCQREEAND